jgi:hypothetical protein
MNIRCPSMANVQRSNVCSFECIRREFERPLGMDRELYSRRRRVIRSRYLNLQLARSLEDEPFFTLFFLERPASH